MSEVRDTAIIDTAFRLTVYAPITSFIPIWIDRTTV